MTKRQSGDIIDVVGPWTEMKLEIIGKYSNVFSTIVTHGKGRFFEGKVPYIDGFANIGEVIANRSGDVISGSALRALESDGFSEYHFVDLENEKIEILKRVISKRYPSKVHKVYTYVGDSNTKIIDEVLPNITMRLGTKGWRGLCVLDPYGAHLKWSLVRELSKHKLDMIINFSMMDLQRTVGHESEKTFDPNQTIRIDEFYGGHQWYETARSKMPSLFGFEIDIKNPVFEKAMLDLYRKQLSEINEYVSYGIKHPGYTNATLYYLIFTSHNPKGYEVANWFVKNYSNK